MKKPMQDSLITAGMMAVVLIGGILIQNKFSNDKNGPDVGIVNSIDFFGTGTIATGNNNTGDIITGDVVEKPLSEIENFYNTKNKKTVYFTVQPTDINGEYLDRTQMLVRYAKNSMQTIKIPSEIKGGYLYVKLRNDLPSGRSAVIYIKAGSWYCGGGLKQIGLTYNNNEYLYKLTNINLVGNGCDGSWLSKISGQTVSIGGYVGTFDGNGIKEITIAWY